MLDFLINDSHHHKLFLLKFHYCVRKKTVRLHHLWVYYCSWTPANSILSELVDIYVHGNDKETKCLNSSTTILNFRALKQVLVLLIFTQTLQVCVGLITWGNCGIPLYQQLRVKKKFLFSFQCIDSEVGQMMQVFSITHERCRDVKDT